MTTNVAPQSDVAATIAASPLTSRARSTVESLLAARTAARAVLLGERERQALELECHVDVADRDVARHEQLARREIEDATQAGPDEQIGDVLGGGRGRGDHADLERALGHGGRQLGDA